jgi:hypothetical protein
MRVKKFTCGITFFTTSEMYENLKQLSDERQVAISELLRDWIADAFERGKCKTEGDKQDGKSARSGSV